MRTRKFRMGWRGHREVATIPVKHSVSWQIADSLWWTSSLVKDCGVGRGWSRLALVQGVRSLSNSHCRTGVMPTLGLSKQGHSPSQLQSLPYHSEISCRMFWQHVKPEAQGKPKPSAANPKTPPGLCYSLSQHLPWLLLAFKIYLKEMGLV